MHFQVVNCPSQVYLFILLERSFFVLLSFSRVLRLSSRLCLCLRERILNRKRNWKWCRSDSLAFSLLNQLVLCYVLLNNTGFSPDKLRVRLPIGLLRKMHQQSVHRAQRYRPVRETARHHSPRANRLERSAKETLASEHRGRDSSAPIPNTRHVDQWW